MGLIKKPKMKIGSTRAHELQTYVNRERASVDRDPYSIVTSPGTFKMKRFAEVKSKVVVPKGTGYRNSGASHTEIQKVLKKTQTSLQEMTTMAAGAEISGQEQQPPADLP